MWLRENIAVLVTQNVFIFFCGLFCWYFFVFIYLVACSSYCNGFSKVYSGISMPHCLAEWWSVQGIAVGVMDFCPECSVKN